MLSTQVEPVEVVSARIYALILTSKRLTEMLLPDGLPLSPYEITDYQVTLMLHDPEGMRATFRRVQEVRFVQEGVAGILDHAWGSGVVVSAYDNDAGTLADSFQDEGRHHMVIALKRRMGIGETLRFNVSRTTMACFAQEAQWWMDTTIDHPIKRLSAGIVFPADRPVRRATLEHAGERVSLSARRLPSGRTLVRFHTSRAHAHMPYIMRWEW